MHKSILILSLFLPITIFAQSNTTKTLTQKQQAKSIKNLVKNCFAKEVIIRETAANHLLNYPIDAFSKKAIQQIKKALHNEELNNFQLMLLVGYLQLKEEKDWLETYIKPSINPQEEKYYPEFSKQFTFDSKQWAAHLALARMETEEYVIHTSFIVEEFYLPNFSNSKHLFTLMEHYAYINKDDAYYELMDFMRENKKVYLSKKTVLSDQDTLVNFNQIIKDLLMETACDSISIDLIEAEKQYSDNFPFAYERLTPNNHPRITYPPLICHLKVDIDTIKLLKEGMAYLNKLPDDRDAIRFLEENSQFTANSDTTIFIKMTQLLGNAYLKNKHPGKAIAIFDKLLELNPSRKHGYIDKTGICRMLSDSLLAMQEFDKARHYIYLLEKVHPAYHGCGNGQSDFESSIRAKKLRYYVGKNMVDSVLFFSYYYIARPYETSYYLPFSVAELVPVIKTKYTKDTLQNMVATASIFSKNPGYPDLDYYYVSLFGYDMALFNEQIEQQREELTKEQLQEAYEEYFKNSEFVRLLEK